MSLLSHITIIISMNNMKTENSKFDGRHALLVVDNDINGMVTNAYLTNVGFTTQLCGGLDETLQYLRDKHVDVILLDVEMPDVSNWDICSNVRKLGGHYVSIPIFAMSSNLAEEVKKANIAAGMSDHIDKPINVDIFSTILWDFLENSATLIEDKVCDATDEPIPEMLGVNVKEGLDRLQNNWELYKKLLITFRESNQNLVASIRVHIANEEFDEAQRIAHTLKGTSGNLSVDEVYTSAATLEKLCKEKNTAEITPSLSALDSVLNNVLNGLNVLSDEPQISTEIVLGEQSDQQLNVVLKNSKILAK